MLYSPPVYILTSALVYLVIVLLRPPHRPRSDVTATVTTLPGSAAVHKTTQQVTYCHDSILHMPIAIAIWSFCSCLCAPCTSNGSTALCHRHACMLFALLVSTNAAYLGSRPASARKAAQCRGCPSLPPAHSSSWRLPPSSWLL